MRKMNKGVHTKWINALSAIKQELETQEIKTVNHLFSKFNINMYWSTWLIQNNVIIRLNGVYHWNEKIPVSAKLINKFRIDYNQLQKKQKKPIQTNENDNGKFLSISEAINEYGKSESTIRSIVKKIGDNTELIKKEKLNNGLYKIYISKDYLDKRLKSKNTVEFVDIIEKNEVGIIRKFLKWLW